MNINRTLGLLLMVAIVAITAMATPALADANMTTTRTISVTDAAPGDTFTVTVAMGCTGNAGDFVNAVGLEETMPVNWTVTAVDSDVHTFSTSQAPLYTWSDNTATPLYAGETRTIVYNVTIPAGESSGIKSISGQATGGRDGVFPPVIVGGTVLGDTDVNVVVQHNPITYVNPGDNIQAAIDNALSGDTIYFNEGTYDLSASGLQIPSSMELTLTGAGAEVVILNFGEQSIAAQNSPDNLTFECITFKGDPGATTYAGCLRIGGAPNVVIRECVFENTVAEISGSDMIEISNNVFRSGIKEYADDRRIGLHSAASVLSGNTFDGTYVLLSQMSDTEITGNTFKNNTAIVQDPTCNYALALETSTGTTVNNNVFLDNEMCILFEQSNYCTITENTFDSNDEGIKISRMTGSYGDGNKIYLNNFVGNTANYVEGDSVDKPMQYVSDSALSYTYRNVLYSAVLGNYYDDYIGEDADGNGIGDTVYAAVSGDDTYPLMSAWNDGEVESSLVILWQGEVTLMNDKFDPSSIDPAAGTSWDSMTDLGALMQTGLAIDASYSPASSYGPASFWINDIGAVGGTGWGILINGQPTWYGLGGNSLSDGDVVEFYAPLWAQDGNGTWFWSVGNANYGVILAVNDDTPVKAIRDIETQTFMQDSVIVTEQHNSTLVTIEFEALKDIEALTVIEEVPEGWILTPADNNGSSFRACPDAADTYEWVWADDMFNGETVTISYIIQIPYNESATTYDFTGFVSAMVNTVDVNGINVDGDDFVVIEEDWNPWDDIDSVANENVVTSELQQAINCWLTDEPAPVTGARITTDRLQEVISQWLASTE